MTSRTLNLGAALELPVDAVTRTAAVVGQKGTGKTSTAVVVVEEAAAAGARFAVMDPTGAWSGLRSSADGEGPGLDCVVMGGHHGDVPLSAGAGEVVARLVVEEGYSVVCDLERMTRSQQITFVADFSTAALELCRSAVTVVYDEAPRFAPQGGAGIDDDGTRCRVAVTELVMLGRRKGLGSILISQRPSKLHKDVLEQADVMVAHRLMGNNDRKAIAGWLEEYGEDAGSWLGQLPKLATGQAVVLAPEYHIGGVFQVRMKGTFDSSATPDVGAVLLDAPRGRASIDLSDLEAKMGHALEAAQENDPAALRRRIRNLEEQLHGGTGGHTDEDLAMSYRDGWRAGETEATTRFRSRIIDLQGTARAMAEQTRLHFDSITASRADFDGVEAAPAPDDRPGMAAGGDLPAALAPPAPRPQAVPRPRPATPTADWLSAERTGTRADAGTAPAAAGTDSLKAGMRRMLDVLARYGPLARRDLAVLSKVSPVSGTVSDYLSVLRGQALVTEADGRVSLTDAGYAAAGYKRGNGIPRPYTPDEVYALWAGDLKAGARRMVEHLMRAHPEGYTRRELAGLAGISPQSGTVSDYMSVLRRRGLVEERQRRVYAGSVLYLGRAS